MTQPSHAIYSANDILAHPTFTEARKVWVDGMLGLYEDDHFLCRLLTVTARSAVFFHLLALDAAYDPADRATRPTIGLLQASMRPYPLSSRRSIEVIVARLVETGYVVRRTTASDRRVRLLTPTEKMLIHDLDWLKVFYSPLAAMFPAYGYAQPMRRDRAFRTAIRRICAGTLGESFALLATNPRITFLMNRDAGMMVLIKLVQTGAAAGLSRMTFTDLAGRFGISRTHVRRILQDAEREGLLRLSDVGIALEPALVASFDRFLADCMSAFHAMFHLATDNSAGHRQSPVLDAYSLGPP